MEKTMTISIRCKGFQRYQECVDRLMPVMVGIKKLCGWYHVNYDEPHVDSEESASRSEFWSTPKTAQTVINITVQNYTQTESKTSPASDLNHEVIMMLIQSTESDEMMEETKNTWVKELASSHR